MGNWMRVATGSSTLEIANSPTTPKIVAIMSCIPRRHLFIPMAMSADSLLDFSSRHGSDSRLSKEISNASQSDPAL